MPTTDETILLDVDPDWCGVLAAAAQRQGPYVYDLVEGPDIPTCPRALASHRLAVRFFAAGPQPGGRPWDFRLAPPFVGDELARRGIADAQGCELPECPICNPPTCKRCGGIMAQACAI
jgi:hypothetical protein